MTTIVAGVFGNPEDATRAEQVLRERGTRAEAIARFHHAPAGQQAYYAPEADAGSAGPGAAVGSAVGAAVGAGLGALTTPATGLVGPIAGAAVGAYVGSLGGALGGISSEAETRPPPPVRHGGPMVAVAIHDDRQQASVADILQTCGAVQVEKAEGSVADGRWLDFDPASTPDLIFDRNRIH